jgi:hypothetical protein
MKKTGVLIECLSDDAGLSNEHCKEVKSGLGNNGGVRWPHTKLYLMLCGRGKKPHLLETSANWSLSAWGAGKITPRNFELGVIVETQWKRLEKMGKQFAAGTAPFCRVETRRIPDDPKLQWAEASWNGKHIVLHARSSDADTPISARIAFADGKGIDISLKDETAAPWQDAQCTPLTARFAQGTETLEVHVLDQRLSAEFARTPLPEVDPSLAATLREKFLLQRYGGPVVDPDFVSGLNEANKTPGAGTPAADYSVQAWLDARAGFDVVDNWRAALTKEAKRKTDPALLERIRLDGEELRAIYTRRAGPAAELVAEEIGWRIKEEA